MRANGSKQQCLVLVRVTGPLYKSTVKIIFAVSTLFPGEEARPLPSFLPRASPATGFSSPLRELDEGGDFSSLSNFYFLKIYLTIENLQRWNGISRGKVR